MQQWNNVKQISTSTGAKIQGRHKNTETRRNKCIHRHICTNSQT